MSLRETFRSALSSIKERRSRSALTVLGILIGIAAVVLTVGLGEGASTRVTSAINALGSNLLIISPGSTTSGPVRGGLGSANDLTMADAKALESPTNAPSIAAVAPIVRTSGTLVAGANTWTAPVTGTTPAWLTVSDRSVIAGTPITTAQVRAGANVALIGSEVAEELFGFASPVGQTMDVNGIPFTVEGELNNAGATSNTNQDDLVVVPITTAQDELEATGAGPYAGTVSEIEVSAKSAALMSAAYQEADDLLLQLHGISVPSEADFTITPQTQLLSTASSVSHTLTVLLAGIAAIALLVGGIGVMNIMLVSVTERIQEIGLRKALGATPSAIRLQFLIEATVLGLAGGIAGVAIGLLGTQVLPSLVGDPIEVSVPAIVGSVVVAAGIGLVFGVYPASRAARLSPIDALRSE